MHLDSSVKSTKVLQPIPINNRVRLESSTSEFANGTLALNICVRSLFNFTLILFFDSLYYSY